MNLGILFVNQLQGCLDVFLKRKNRVLFMEEN